MIIARQKRKENIAEYILYMWQIEDAIRALNFDIGLIKTHLIEKFDQPENIKGEMVLWYENLIEMMRLEKLEERGHIRAVYNLISDLNDVHKYLRKTPGESKYQQLYQQVEADIRELKTIQMSESSSDIEACFNFLYGILLLKMSKKSVSESTQKTLEKISSMLALLAKKHKDIEDGLLELDI